LGNLNIQKNLEIIKLKLEPKIMKPIPYNPPTSPKSTLGGGLHFDIGDEQPTLGLRMLKYADSPEKKPLGYYLGEIQSPEEIIINPIKKPEQGSKSESYIIPYTTPKLSDYDPLKFCPLCKHLDSQEVDSGTNRELFRDHDSGSVQDFDKIIINQDSEEEGEFGISGGKTTSQPRLKKHANDEEYMFPSLKPTHMNER
jgi:uncharacterized protein YktA (UPF0223 family)